MLALEDPDLTEPLELDEGTGKLLVPRGVATVLELPVGNGGETMLEAPDTDELPVPKGGETEFKELDADELPVPRGGETVLEEPITDELPVPRRGVTVLELPVGKGGKIVLEALETAEPPVPKEVTVLEGPDADELPVPTTGETMLEEPAVDELPVPIGGETVFELPVGKGGETLLDALDIDELPVPRGGENVFVDELADPRIPEELVAALPPPTGAVLETLLPEAEVLPLAESLPEVKALPVIKDDPDGALRGRLEAVALEERLPKDEGAAVGWSSHDSLTKWTSVGPTRRDAIVPSASTTSVKTEGGAPPLDAQGTGMISTRVPMVVVIVEHAVTVPVATIAPFVICTSAGASGGACGRAYTGSKGRNRRRERKVAILDDLTGQWSIQEFKEDNRRNEWKK